MTGNRYIDRKSKLIGHAGRQSERKVAKELRARLTPASGAMEGAKGDMAVSGFLIEAKSTSSGSLSIKLDWLSKIRHEAVHSDKLPALTVTFTDRNGEPVSEGQWIMIPLSVWKDIVK